MNGCIGNHCEPGRTHWRFVRRAVAVGVSCLLAFAVYRAAKSGSPQDPSAAEYLDLMARGALPDSLVIREFDRLGAAAHPDVCRALRGIETPFRHWKRRLVEIGPARWMGFSGWAVSSTKDLRLAALRVLEAHPPNSHAAEVSRALVSLLDDPEVSGDAARILARVGPGLAPLMPELISRFELAVPRSLATNYITVLWSTNHQGNRWLHSAQMSPQEGLRDLGACVARWDSGEKDAVLNSLDHSVFGIDGELRPGRPGTIRRDFAVKLLELMGPEVWPLAGRWVGRLATLHSDESRQVTVWALGLIGSEHVTRRELDALEQVLASEAPTWVRVTAIDALGKLGQEARPILEPLLHGADEESIQAARLALMDLERRR